MLSVKSISSKDAGGSAAYYESLAVADDYYSTDEVIEAPGYWAGGLARDLGLVGDIRRGQVAAMLAGMNPQSGAAFDERVGQDNRKPGWDCTFSAPKSVSIAWALGDAETREAISQAQRLAVDKGLDYIARHALFSRYGHSGEDRIPTETLLAACFEHSTNRNLDPQLHTHALIANTDGNGRAVTLDTHFKMVAGALYRAELAIQIRKLGFKIERDGQFFKLAGIPDDLVQLTSTRRKQILEAAERYYGTKALSAKQLAALTLASRDKKQAVPRPLLFEQWEKLGREHEFTSAHVSALQHHQTIVEDGNTLRSLVPLAQEQAEARIEWTATVQDQDVMRELVPLVYGAAGAAEIEDAVTLALTDSSRFQALSESRFTTHSMLAAETALAGTAEELARSRCHPVPQAVIDHSANDAALTSEQREAVHKALTGGDLVTWQGRAGAGKTYALNAVRCGFEEAGYRVIGTSLANRAADELSGGAKVEADSIAKLIYDLDRGKNVLDGRTILIIDEAGMVSTRLTVDLLSRAAKAKSKVVVVGDTGQLQSIGAGAALKVVQEAAHVNGAHVELADNLRQLYPEDRIAALELRAGDAAQALARIDKRGGVHISDLIELSINKAAHDYLESIQEHKSALLIAGTHKQCQALNDSLREALKQNQLIVDCEQLATSHGEIELGTGDRVRFTASVDPRSIETLSRGGHTRVKNNVFGTVISIQTNAITIKLDSRSTKRGEVEGALIRLRTGIDLPLRHGHAATLHSSQGATVDKTHWLATGPMIQIAGRQGAYVAGTRHRESLSIYTTKADLDPQSLDEARTGNLRALSDSDFVRALSRDKRNRSAREFLPIPTASSESRPVPLSATQAIAVGYRQADEAASQSTPPNALQAIERGKRQHEESTIVQTPQHDQKQGRYR
jgi:conjugative relaxase-like TrwC/TraI family protein